MSDPFSLGFGALGAAKAAFDLTKAFSDIRDATKVQALKFELMGLLLDAQEAQATLLAEKRQLEERVRELEAWDREKQRYQLTAVVDGTVAYALKPEAQGSEVSHQLCTACFSEGHKGFLQREMRVPGMNEYLVCQRCNSEIALQIVHPEHRGAKPRKPPAPPKGGYRF